LASNRLCKMAGCGARRQVIDWGLVQTLVAILFCWAGEVVQLKPSRCLDLSRRLKTAHQSSCFYGSSSYGTSSCLKRPLLIKLSGLICAESFEVGMLGFILYCAALALGGKFVTANNDPSIFERIMAGEIPSEMIYEDDQAIVIKDINPQAPTHVLIIPRVKIPKLVDANDTHQALLGHLLLVAGKVAGLLGCADAFRLVINNGAAAGQTVFHLHLHILAGKGFSEAGLASPFN